MLTDYDQVFSISYLLSKTSSFISIVETISSVPIDTETYDGALLKPEQGNLFILFKQKCYFITQRAAYGLQPKFSGFPGLHL